MPNILVVADEQWVVNDVRAVLSDGSYAVTEVADPRQAAERALADGAHVVITDMQVGSMGGMAVTRAIRAIGEQAPPVIILLDRDSDGFLARRAGAAGWVRKPFSAPELRTAIDACVGVEA